MAGRNAPLRQLLALCLEDAGVQGPIQELMGMGIFSLHRYNKVMSTQLRVPNTSLTSFWGASG
eukprot:386334-Heterocapsa_arctica.AAC.1